MAQLQSTSVTGSLIISGSSTTLVSSGSTVLDIQGSVGQLFSVTDSLTGVLMSVNDISGLPILEVSSDDKVVMGTFGAEGLIVTGSNVNIGKISSNTHKVTGSLNVSGSQNLVGDLAITTTSTNPSITITDTSSNDPYIRFIPATTTNAFAVGIDDSDSDKFKISYGSNAVLGTNDFLTISSSGNVGIGNTSPTAKLAVDGNIAIRAGDKIQLSGQADATHHFYHDTGTDYDKVNYTTGWQFEHYTSGVQMTIRSNGTVGIGTEIPGCTLSVVGSICSSDQIRGANIITAGTVCAASNICTGGISRGANLCATTSICGPMVCVSGTITGGAVSITGTLTIGGEIQPSACLLVRTAGTIRSCIDANGICTPGTLRASNVCAITSICGPLIVSSGINRGANLCATTSVCSPRGIFSSCVDSCIYTSNAGGLGVKVGTTEVNSIYFDDPINGGTWYYSLHGGLTTDRNLL